MLTLHVDIVEPDCSIIRLGHKPLVVPEVYGLSDVVDGNVVSFSYEKKSSLVCSIHLDTHNMHLPAHGQLVTGEPEKATKRGDEPESFIHLRQQLGNLQYETAWLTSDDDKSVSQRCQKLILSYSV